MAWETPVVDRILADITALTAVRTKILATGLSSLTSEELTLWWGCCGDYKTDVIPTFTRATTAYKQDGSSVASGVERFEYHRMPAPIWSDLFATDLLLSDYTSGGDIAGTWAVTGGKLTGVSVTNSQSTLIKNDLLLKDLEIEVDSDQASDSGIIARYQDNNNYYLLVFQDDSSTAPTRNLIIYKKVAGAWTQLSGDLNVAWTRGTSKLIKFTLHGSLLEVWFDGLKVISLTDTVFTGGGVGLRQSSDTATNFLDFKVFSCQQGIMIEEGTNQLLANNFFKTYTGTINDGTVDTFTNWNIYDTGGNDNLIEAVTGEFGGVACKHTQTTATAAGKTKSFYQVITIASVGIAVGDIVSIAVRYKMSAQVNSVVSITSRFSDGVGFDEYHVLVESASAAVPCYKTVKAEYLAVPAGTVYIIIEGFVMSTAAYSGGANTLELDYFSVEEKGCCSSGTDVTRNVELLTIPLAGIFTKGNWKVDTVFTSQNNLWVDFKVLWYVAIDATNWYRLGVWYDGSIWLQVSSGGTEYTVTSGVTLVLGTSYLVTASGDGAHLRLCLNGAQIGSDTDYVEPAGTLPTNIQIGSYSTGYWTGNSILSSFRVGQATQATLAKHVADYNTGKPLEIEEYTTYLMPCDGSLSTPDRPIAEVKGALNILDLNRIENNIDYLRDELLSNGYGAIITDRVAGTWLMADIPYIVEEINRIRENIRTLVGMLPVGSVPVIVDTEFLDYLQVNDLEQSLETLYDSLILMILNYNPCGTLVCGEVYA